MIEKMRLEEAKRNVKTYIEDGLFSIQRVAGLLGKSIGTNYLD